MATLQTSPIALTPIADYFKLLSEVSRLQVLCALKSGAKNVTEIVEITKLGQANVSKHLKMLAAANIVTREARGVTVFYKITDPLIFELCELVCKRLQERFEQQSQQLKLLEELRSSKN